MILKLCTCFYCDVKIFFYFNVWLDKYSWGNIFFYDFSYKTLLGAETLYIRSGKVDGFIGVYDGNRYFVFGFKKLMRLTLELDTL